MSERTIAGLKCMQAAPLSVKVRMTESRIRDWVNEFGEDGVFVSFSGGKDSTVLLDIARKMYPNIKAMFVDVPTQYPELRQFVKKFPNVDITRPEINFVQACEKYGFPFFSKEIAESIQGAKKYLKTIMQQCDNPIASKQAPYRYWYERITGTGNYQKNPTTPSIADENALMEHSEGGYDRKYRRIRGIGEFAQRKEAQSRRWLKSEIGDNAWNADERRSDSSEGEYP